MTLKSGQQIITIHILFNISSSQCNQAMKIGQLIEYNIRNIFIEKLYTKYGGEASPRPFHKNQNWTYLWTNSLKCYKVCFYCMFKSKVYQNIFKLKCRTLVFILYKAFFFFFKKKKNLFAAPPPPPPPPHCTYLRLRLPKCFVETI